MSASPRRYGSLTRFAPSRRFASRLRRAMYSSLLRRVVGESVGPGIPQGQHDPSKRDRLLVVAEELFYAEGINTVGIDRVIEGDPSRAIRYVARPEADLLELGLCHAEPLVDAGDHFHNLLVESAVGALGHFRDEELIHMNSATRSSTP